MILPLFIPISINFSLSKHFLICSIQLILNSSCICIVISCLTIFSNFADFLVSGYGEDHGVTGPTLMYIFFTGLIVFSFGNIIGVFRAKPVIFFFSFSIWLLLVIFWFCVVALLYSDWYMVPDLCINHRCPDSFWLNDWYWRSRKEIVNHTEVDTVDYDVKTRDFQSKYYYYQDYFPMSNVTESARVEVNFWYSLGSVMVCFSFILYLAFLGSMIWNHCSAVCTMRRADEYNTMIPPRGYLYVVELRRRSIVDGESGPSASTNPNQPAGQVPQSSSKTALPKTQTPQPANKSAEK